MRVVDEETLHATDLETAAPTDEESRHPEDPELPKEPPPLERAPRPEPELSPEEEVEFTPVKPKRKPRKPKEILTKGEVLIPALEKPKNAFVESSKLRKERLKEKIECPNGCGKQITRHAASYTHDKTCSALKRMPSERAELMLSGRAERMPSGRAERKESEIQTEEIVVKEPDFDRKEEEKRMRKPLDVPPNVDFMERIKKAAFAYRQLEEQKHGMLIRQYFQR